MDEMTANKKARYDRQRMLWQIPRDNLGSDGLPTEDQIRAAVDYFRAKYCEPDYLEVNQSLADALGDEALGLRVVPSRLAPYPRSIFVGVGEPWATEVVS